MKKKCAKVLCMTVIAVLVTMVGINVNAGDSIWKSSGVIKVNEHDDVVFDSRDFANIADEVIDGKTLVAETINSINDGKSRITSADNYTIEVLDNGIREMTTGDELTTADKILSGFQGYKDYSIITGTIPKQAVSDIQLSNSKTSVTLPAGYYERNFAVMMPDNGSIVKAVNIISCNGSAVSKSSTNTSIKDKISSLTTTAIDGNGSYGAKTYIYHNHTLPDGTKLSDTDTSHELRSGQTSTGGCYGTQLYHRHDTSSTTVDSEDRSENTYGDDYQASSSGGCFTKAWYHWHDDNSNHETTGSMTAATNPTQQGCYTQAKYHWHQDNNLHNSTGSQADNVKKDTPQGCYTKAVQETVTCSGTREMRTIEHSCADRNKEGHHVYCTNPDGVHDDTNGFIACWCADDHQHFTGGACGSTTNKTKYIKNCSNTANQLMHYALVCTHTADQIMYYTRACGKTVNTEVNSKKTCGWTNHMKSGVTITYGASS